jgi:hypothetical protein
MLHKEEFRNLYSSPDITEVLKLRGLRWEGHVAWMNEERKIYTILFEECEGHYNCSLGYFTKQYRAGWCIGKFLHMLSRALRSE